MQTSFSLAQLADPDVAEADKILRACVHCGFCTATCPTYVLLGDERDSPRGRIYLIKDMLENERPATGDVVRHIDRCLSCLACMTTCPSGVHYMHLVDHARYHIARTYTRPWLERAIREFLLRVMPYPRRLRVASVMAALGRPFAPLLAAFGLKPLAAAIRLAPSRAPGPYTETGVHPAQGPRRGRVALMRGCANEALAPSITQAAIRLLNRHGVEVVIPPGEGCCGSLAHHMGREAETHAFVTANVDAWTREIEGEGLDAILVTLSGCGTTVKDYGFMLRNDAAYADKAAKVSALTRDATEYLATLGIRGSGSRNLAVAYHSACSLQHGQKVTRQPKELLAACGFDVRDVPEGHLCCGSAGTYNILQPDIAVRLRARKIANIEKVAPDAIAAANVGCIAQLASGTGIPVVHPVELIDWATGGPVPDGLKGRA
ncbi:MAG: glycolate oxidase subunit GlcF [Alphaproteobacteria bacterium]|nr:glycolate oxidase subunit GlcF [Alphaproteobacteria bacterium]